MLNEKQSSFSWYLVLLILGFAFALETVAEAVPQTLSTRARKAPVEYKDQISQLLRHSGWKRIVEKLGPDQLAQIDTLAYLKIPREELVITKNLFAGSYNKDDFYQVLSDTLVVNFSRSKVSRALKWFKSALGQKIIQKEISVLLDEEASAKAESMVEALIKSKQVIPENRKEWVKRLDNARGYSSFKRASTLTTVRYVSRMEDIFSGKSFGGFSKKMEKQEDVLKNRNLMLMLYTYSDLKDSELRKLVQFAESSAGRWYYRWTSKGYINALKKVGSNVSNQLELLMDSLKAGRSDETLIRRYFPPGIRYLYIKKKKRDPFLAYKELEPKVKVADVAKLFKKKLPPKPKVEKVKKAKPRIQKFGKELKKLKPVPYQMFLQLKEVDPILFGDVEYYSGLFRDRKELIAMKDAEYLDTVDFFAEILDKVLQSQDKLLKTPLQIDYESLKLTGILWNGFGTIGLIETPDGTGHTVRKGTLLGPNFGTVEVIDQDKLVVVEKEMNYQGEILETRKELVLYIENDQVAQK